jgi:hypothetical protein
VPRALIFLGNATDMWHVRSRLLTWYGVGQALAIAAFFFVPVNGWVHTTWQLVVGYTSAAFVLVGTRRNRPEGGIAWYLFAAGLVLNVTGVIAEALENRVFHTTFSPSVSDLFFLGIFPGLIGGLVLLAYRRTAHEDLAGLIISTAVCVVVSMFLAIFAWEYIVWQENRDHSVALARRLVVTAYPLADVIVIALMVRLMFGGGARNPAFACMLGSLGGFLIADVGWSIFTRASEPPTPVQQHLLEMASMAAFALMGASALHPASRTIAPSIDGQPIRLSLLGWAALGISALTAPIVLIVQAVLDHLYSLNSF